MAKSSQWFEEVRNIVATATEWDDEEYMVPNENLNVQFSKSTLERLRAPWKLTLMGRCMGLSVRSTFMDQRARIMWKVKGSLETIDLGQNVFLFRFSVQDDYERTLFGGPWFVLDHYLMLTKWKPNFRPSIHSFESMVVWLRFPELPVEYYDKQALFEIDAVAGKPIRVDYATDRLTRARYARVCVEINLSQPLATKVWVCGSNQVIVYENITSLCFGCGKIGHEKAACISAPTLNSGPNNSVAINAHISPTLTMDKDAPVPGQQDATTIGSGLAHTSIECSDDYGPWTLVTKKRIHRGKVDHSRLKKETGKMCPMLGLMNTREILI